MAIYVTSDAHGHARALEEALLQINLQPEDELYVLGDMIDRGPDPLSVIKLVRCYPNAHVLMGNHERMMLGALLGSASYDKDLWQLNGGFSTYSQYEALSHDEQVELLSWMQGLPKSAVVEAGGRSFILVHAGICIPAALVFLMNFHEHSNEAETSEEREDASEETSEAPDNSMKSTKPQLNLSPEALRAMLAEQDEETLLWVRGGFWDCPTRLIDEKGNGPIIISGHTPSVNLGYYASAELMSSTGLDPDTQRGTIVEVGACEATNYVPEKIDIDCSAAAGSDYGAVGILRLDDFEQWIIPINQGE